jgi:hypothetical protein
MHRPSASFGPNRNNPFIGYSSSRVCVALPSNTRTATPSPVPPPPPPGSPPSVIRKGKDWSFTFLDDASNRSLVKSDTTTACPIPSVPPPSTASHGPTARKLISNIPRIREIKANQHNLQISKDTSAQSKLFSKSLSSTTVPPQKQNIITSRGDHNLLLLARASEESKRNPSLPQPILKTVSDIPSVYPTVAPVHPAKPFSANHPVRMLKRLNYESIFTFLHEFTSFMDKSATWIPLSSFIDSPLKQILIYQMEIKSERQWNNLSNNDFIKFLKRMVSSSSKEETKKRLASIHLQYNENEDPEVAIDNYDKQFKGVLDFIGSFHYPSDNEINQLWIQGLKQDKNLDGFSVEFIDLLEEKKFSSIKENKDYLKETIHRVKNTIQVLLELHMMNATTLDKVKWWTNSINKTASDNSSVNALVHPVAKKPFVSNATDDLSLDTSTTKASNSTIQSAVHSMSIKKATLGESIGEDDDYYTQERRIPEKSDTKVVYNTRTNEKMRKYEEEKHHHNHNRRHHFQRGNHHQHGRKNFDGNHGSNRKTQEKLSGSHPSSTRLQMKYLG